MSLSRNSRLSNASIASQQKPPFCPMRSLKPIPNETSPTPSLNTTPLRSKAKQSKANTASPSPYLIRSSDKDPTHPSPSIQITHPPLSSSPPLKANPRPPNILPLPPSPSIAGEPVGWKSLGERSAARAAASSSIPIKRDRTSSGWTNGAGSLRVETGTAKGI